MEIVNSLWVEKYRPRTLKDIVLPDQYREDFEKYLEAKDIPNLLLNGPPGGGKTTLAKILTSKEGLITNRPDNLLEMNGSAKKTRSINYVHDVIEPFLKVPPAGKDPLKIVFIDEGDKLTSDAFDALKGIMESYTKSTRFITTCNNIHKIPSAIQSRHTEYKFDEIPMEFAMSYCERILKTENVKYDTKDIKYVVDRLYPDIRRVVNKLQRFSLAGELVLDKNVVIGTENTLIALVIEIVDLYRSGNVAKVKKTAGKIQSLTQEPDINFTQVYERLFFKTLPPNVKIIINKYANGHGDCLIPTTHFMAMVFEIMKCLSDYNKMKAKK